MTAKNSKIELRYPRIVRASILERFILFKRGTLFASRSFVPFPFENLKAYQISLDWVEATEQLCKTSKNELTRAFVDQFQRAALSIPLNLAEGNGRWHAAEKCQFFWIARGPVFECVPLIDILKRKKLLSDVDYEKAKDQLDHLGRMLTKLVQAHE